MSSKVNEEFESTFWTLLNLAERLAKPKSLSGRKEKKALSNFIASINDPDVLQEALYKLKNPISLISSEQIIIVKLIINEIIPTVTEMLEKKYEEINLRRRAGSRKSVILSSEEFTVEVEAWIVAKTKILYTATYTNYVGQLADFVHTQREIEGFVKSISEISQLDRMVEDLEASKLVNGSPEYAKTVDNVITQIILPRKNTLAENQENSKNLVEEPEASPAKKVAHHRGIFGALKQLFQNGKSTTVKEEIINATVLATTDAVEDLGWIDAEDFVSGKGDLELVGLEVEATGLKKLIQDFKAKHSERKAAALKGLNDLDAKTKPKSKFNKEFEKLIKQYDNNDFLAKGYPAILKIIAKNNDISTLERAIKNIPALGPDDLDIRINIHAALAHRIDEIRWPIAEKDSPSQAELKSESPRESVNLDELVEPDFTPEQLRQSGAFSDEEFSAMIEESAERPKRFDIFLKLKELTGRLKRTEKRVQNVQNEDQAEKDRIQKQLDESLNDSEATFIFLGDVIDTDNLLAGGILIDGMIETVQAVDSVEKSAKSHQNLDNSRFANFKKVVSDVCGAVSEKIFPFINRLEKLAILYEKANDNKKRDIEKKIDKLIDSKSNILDLLRALENINRKHEMVFEKLESKLLVLGGAEVLKDFEYTPLQELKKVLANLDDLSLDVDSLEETKEELPPTLPKYAQDAAEPARKAAEEGRKGPESTDEASFTKK